MHFWTVEGGNLVLYKRSGECNKCGQCCCTRTINYSMEVGFQSGKREDEGIDSFDWSCREGWSMFLAQGIWWYFKINEVTDRPVPCLKLNDRNECEIWHDIDEFPPICRYWPFHPSDLKQFPDCSFRFERVGVGER